MKNEYHPVNYINRSKTSDLEMFDSYKAIGVQSKAAMIFPLHEQKKTFPPNGSRRAFSFSQWRGRLWLLKQTILIVNTKPL